MGQSLVDYLSQVRGGFALVVAGEKLADAITAVLETGKKGSVTLTIDVSPDKNDETIIHVQPSVKAKIPEKGFTEGVFFWDASDRKLSQSDPRQMDMLKQREESGVANLARVGRGFKDE